MGGNVRIPLALFLSWILIGPALADEPSPLYERRWFYSMTNLQVEENADLLIDLIGRAKAAGYNGVVLADYKHNILDRVPEHYFKNLARVRDAADKAGIEIIPTLFAIGYSNGVLAHDPNLAEGLPVVDAPFVVNGREAVLDSGSSATVANGDFEKTEGDRFAAFGFQDDPGRATFADHEVVHQGKTSLRIENARDGNSGNARVIQRVTVRPHACYRLSAWVKTDGFSSPGSFRLLAIGAGKDDRSLTFQEGGIAPSQDWKRVSVVFNSLDNDSVNLYAGLWGTSAGSLWIDELTLEELSLVNVLRRDGCPFRVASADGKTVYVEGRDYEPVHDPKLGQVPYAGEFDFDHPGPVLRLTADSSIKPGQRLLVSWYHPVLIHGEQIVCCLSEPKLYEILRDQARRVNELYHPKTFFMSHDEFRVANWCQACQARGMTPGQLLADNVRRCTEILKEIHPDAEIVVWSDMFDPNHNAVDRYYLVNGTLEGSWKGLPKEVILANWNGGKARASLEWFARLGHRQIIAGYYDADDLSNFQRWTTAAKDVPGVLGFLYTTWQAKYGLLDEYGRAMLGRD